MVKKSENNIDKYRWSYHNWTTCTYNYWHNVLGQEKDTQFQIIFSSYLMSVKK